ncbi:phospholipase D-like domain-containing protein [Paraburkholderia rhizosphaerae]|uniref:phospholipase D n=1 Tax=Paraburkholderia rhizosphaerae TaxID=480658 RepID=A0A4R8M056_9BURK|nr:phospholipase D-like domain-containing protein [Paraburkholderia rhizosphaerae]TDY54616.1 phospholipase D-like protein [Paraburkholderia rhizosphaerae]
MSAPFVSEGNNARASFTLKLHRGESMVLIAMNWRNGEPPDNFVGWFISYLEPGGSKPFELKNRLGFDYRKGQPSEDLASTKVAPIQKFRWVHFPFHAENAGTFRYKVEPVFMDADGKLSYGEAQEADIDLGIDTYADELNVAFTRGFVSSQAFVDRYQKDDHTIDELIPDEPDDGLSFKPTHPDAAKALAWMGFEAQEAIIGLLDEAISDKTAKVDAIVYDFNVPEILAKLETLGPRLRIVIDDSKSTTGGHDRARSPESKAAARLKSAGAQVKRQHMGNLQHNKTVVVRGRSPAALCGSTNFSWRGLYVQANNAVVVRGEQAAEVFTQAFESYWSAASAKDFRKSPSATEPWESLDLPNIKAAATFSPHSKANAVLDTLSAYVSQYTKSNVLFALAFLWESKGSLREAITGLQARDDIFVYGMSDRALGGLDLKLANGHMAVVKPDYLVDKDTPLPFKAEPSSLSSDNSGTRLHHKFIVTDFDKPNARVYMGSFNFSPTADEDNGENLLVFEDQRVATAYMVEALRLFDHYEWRVARHKAKADGKPLVLKKPPRARGDEPWWKEDWTDKRKAADRLLFS